MNDEPSFWAGIFCIGKITVYRFSGVARLAVNIMRNIEWPGGSYNTWNISFMWRHTLYGSTFYIDRLTIYKQIYIYSPKKVTQHMNKNKIYFIVFNIILIQQ